MSNIRATNVTLHIGDKVLPVKALNVLFADAALTAQMAFARLGVALWAHRLAEVFGSTDPTLESLLPPERP
jgi:hypothetical protein